MINWKRVKELEGDIGADEIDGVVELFLDEVETVIGPLRAGAVGRNIEEDMHFLKGSALNLGFEVLGAMCSKGEKLAAGGQVEKVPIAEILVAFDASKTEFLAQMVPGFSD